MFREDIKRLKKIQVELLINSRRGMISVGKHQALVHMLDACHDGQSARRGPSTGVLRGTYAMRTFGTYSLELSQQFVPDLKDRHSSLHFFDHIQWLQT